MSTVTRRGLFGLFPFTLFAFGPKAKAEECEVPDWKTNLRNLPVMTEVIDVNEVLKDVPWGPRMITSYSPGGFVEEQRGEIRKMEVWVPNHLKSPMCDFAYGEMVLVQERGGNHSSEFSYLHANNNSLIHGPQPIKLIG